MSLVFLVLLIVGLAALIKLSARILRDMVVTWKSSVLFSIFYLSVIVLFRLTMQFANIKIPFAAGFPLGFVALLAVGGWFFRKRLTDNQGNKLGWRGGTKLMAVVYGGLCIISIFAFGALYVIKYSTGH